MYVCIQHIYIYIYIYKKYIRTRRALSPPLDFNVAPLQRLPLVLRRLELRRLELRGLPLGGLQNRLRPGCLQGEGVGALDPLGCRT